MLQQEIIQTLRKFNKLPGTTPAEVLANWSKTVKEVEALLSVELPGITVKNVLANPGQFQGDINMVRSYFDKQDKITELDLRRMPVKDATYMLRQCVSRDFKRIATLDELIAEVLYK